MDHALRAPVVYVVEWVLLYSRPEEADPGLRSKLPGADRSGARPEAETDNLKSHFAC